METTTTTHTLNPNATSTTTTTNLRVCFSFAAYAKTLIRHLRSCNVPVHDGLTDSEFSSIESSLNFTFPPDLRSILREGLPVGLGFPNWRAASFQQLHLLTSLPLLAISKQVSNRNLWCESWGHEPDNAQEALFLAKRALKKAPVLVPIYSHCYIPSMPSVAGNPVFSVHGGEVKLASYDVAGFFERIEFPQPGLFPPLNSLRAWKVKAPAWAATVARRIEFWTEVVEKGKSCGGAGGWWSGELGARLEEAFWRLRKGGWAEEEVSEMMMMVGDSSGEVEEKGLVVRDREGVMWQVRRLSFKLLHAGWSTEDVVYSLGLEDESFLSQGDC